MQYRLRVVNTKLTNDGLLQVLLRLAAAGVPDAVTVAIAWLCVRLQGSPCRAVYSLLSYAARKPVSCWSGGSGDSKRTHAIDFAIRQFVNA